MKIKLIPIIILGILVVTSCDKDEETSATDAELYEFTKTDADYTWYKGSNALLPKSNLSGHTEPFLRTRFNSIAATKLNDLGKVQTGISFPDGSIIIKELYSNQTTLAKYAILYKKSGHTDADNNGWVWGYLSSNGNAIESASKKGNGCIACHSQNGNINYTLMNVSFP